MSTLDHIINVLFLNKLWPNDYFISSINCFGDSVDDFSVARFIIKNPNLIAPTKRPNINIGAAHSNAVFNEGRVKRTLNDVNGFFSFN